MRYEELAKAAGESRRRGEILHKAAICALVLRDKGAAKRLLPYVMKSDHDDDQLLTGRLVILSDDEVKAKSVIRSIEAKNRPDRITTAAQIAADLPDKTILKRLIRKMESERQIANDLALITIAIKIGDKELMGRMLQKAEQSFTAFSYSIIKALVPYQPEVAKPLLKRFYQNVREQESWLKEVGEIAAILGDIPSAEKAMRKLSS